MVKIPGLDDLKKMGTDIIDSAKTVNISGVVDKLGMKKGAGPVAPGDDLLAKWIQEANATLVELVNMQAQQAQLAKKLQGQLAEINKVAATYQKPVVAANDVTKQDEGKSS